MLLLETNAGIRIKVDGTIYDTGFRPLVLDALCPMIARTQAHRLLDEIGNKT